MHLGAILPVLEAILAVLEASWRPSWAILAVLEAILGVLEASWAVLRPSWGLLGGLLGRHGAILEASWVLLGRCWGPLGPSWAVGELKRRTCENHKKGKSLIFAFSGLPGGRLGGVLGRLGGLWRVLWAV